MSDEGEGFLKRWSRLKRTGEVVPAPEAMPEPVVEEAIATPPPADTIPLEEIGNWLKQRLPAGWREVALRRVWSADIAIRDHIGLADYAWDFTVSGDMPGGVPGWGPLTAADDLASLLSRAIGETQEAAESASVSAMSDSDESAEEPAGEPSGLPPSARNDQDTADDSAQSLQPLPVIPANPALTALQHTTRRRGGTAAPIFLEDPPV